VECFFSLLNKNRKNEYFNVKKSLGAAFGGRGWGITFPNTTWTKHVPQSLDPASFRGRDWRCSYFLVCIQISGNIARLHLVLYNITMSDVRHNRTLPMFRACIIFLLYWKLSCWAVLYATPAFGACSYCTPQVELKINSCPFLVWRVWFGNRLLILIPGVYDPALNFFKTFLKNQT
jgi:hypothetical protein